MVDWRYFQRIAHSRFHKLLNGKQPEASTTPAFLLTFSFAITPPWLQTDRSLESFCSACKLSQHLLEVRLTETSTCYMTERTGGEPEY